MRLDSFNSLKLYMLRCDTDSICFEITFHITNKQRMEGFLIIDSSDGIYWKLEDSIELGFVKEDDLDVAIVKTTDNDDLIPDGGYGYEDG